MTFPFKGNNRGKAFFSDPRVHFPLFLLSNLLLSYSPLTLVFKISVGLVGILLPLLAVMFWEKDEKRALDPATLDPRPSQIKPVFFWLLAILAVATRFYGLMSLSLWPTRDDGNYSFAAMEMNQKALLPFFYGIGEQAPVFRYLQAYFMRFVEPSLLSVWLFPAVLSLFIVPAAYWAARGFASKKFSLVFAFLAAGSFWPVLLGRFCLSWGLFCTWQLIVFGVMARVLKEERNAKNKFGPLVLGLTVGAGFYIAPVLWFFMASAVTAGIVVRSCSSREKGRELIIPYVAVLSAVLAPLAFELWSQGFGRHVQEVWAGGKGGDNFSKLFLCGRYLSGLFWNGDAEGYNYGPVAGGFLNPLFAAFFFAGMVRLIRARSSFWVRWSILAGVFFLLPGFLTYDVEMQRLLLELPFLLWAAALGIFRILSLTRTDRAPVFLILVLGAGLGADIYRLAVPLPRYLNLPWGSQSLKSEESYNAYRILKDLADREGPGLIFTDYVSVPLDQTLLLGTDPFNAAYNLKLGNSRPRWMAFLTNVNYQPFLGKRFPEAHWEILGSSRMPWDGELMLGVIPITLQNRSVVESWRKVQTVFHGLTLGILSLSEGKSREAVLDRFLKEHSLVEGDPFLESVFWEIAYFNHSADKKFTEASNDLAQILQRGYPAAHIYNELGTLLWFKGEPQYAQKAFMRALSLGGPHTLAGENLKAMADSQALAGPGVNKRD